MPSPSRILRGPTGGRQSLRAFFGKMGYFPVVTRASKKFGTGQSRGLTIPDLPQELLGVYTEPEWYILSAHSFLGLDPGTDFRAQDDTVLEGIRVDFFEIPLNMVIEVQGIFHHYVGYGPDVVQKDLDRRTKLEATGKTVVYIDDDDALADPVFYLDEALRGRDHSRLVQGIV